MVNVIAHKCLMLAYGEDRHRVLLADVRMAAGETSGPALLPSWWDRLRRVRARPPGGVDKSARSVGASILPKPGP